MGQLSVDEQAKIEEMLKQGMTMEQIYRKLTGMFKNVGSSKYH